MHAIGPIGVIKIKVRQ